jgi:predicted CoA-binding protein
MPKVDVVMLGRDPGHCPDVASKTIRGAERGIWFDVTTESFERRSTQQFLRRTRTRWCFGRNRPALALTWTHPPMRPP